MSSKIDERIVAMKFDNSQFEKGIAQTTGSLGELSKALEMGKIAEGVQTIASRFSAVGAIAFTALQRVTNAAIDAGMNMANALLTPIVEGGKKRALAIEQAKFQFKGLGMDVQATMDVALAAVKGTAFGLDEAAAAAANFGASAIPIEGIGTALKGIAGVAALSGSSFADIADVFSKVAGQGRLMADDLNRLASRGVNAAATLATALGTTEVEVRKLVTEGKISFDLFASTMDNAFGEHSKKASDTFQGASANMRAALSRIGASFATADFEGQRRQLNAFTPVIDNVAAALTPVINAFTEFTQLRSDGIVTILDALNFQSLPDKPPPFFMALQNIFEYLLAIVKPIKDAFYEIFPPATAATIQNMAMAFYNFTRNLSVGGKQAAQIKLTFKGLFAIFDIARIIIGKVFTGIKSLFGMIDTGNGSILAFTASIGAWLMRARLMVQEGTVIENIFAKIREVGQKTIDVFKNIGSAIATFFTRPAAQAGDMWGGVQEAWQKFIDWLPKAWDWIKTAFANVTETVQNAFRTMDFKVLVGLLNFGALAGIGVIIKKAFDKLPGLFGQIGGGFLDSLKGMFDGVTGAMEAMQTKLKADVLTKIAIAIGILAASMAVLAMIEPERLSNSLGAMVVMMISLISALVALEKFIGPKQIAKLTLLSGAMIAMGTAMLVMAAAIAILGTLDIAEMGIALLGLATGMGIMVGAVVLLDKMKVGPKMLLVAPAFQIMANAMVVLATALKILGHLDVGQAGIALGLLTTSMAAMVGAMGLANKIGVAGAAPMLAMAGAILIISGALKVFASMSVDEINRSLTMLVGSLAALTLAMAVMSKLGGPGLIGAAAMVIVVGAITLLTGALKIMATMSWDDIGRTMVVLGGALAILAGGMALMGFPLVMAGSVGILAASVALMMLAPALKILGSMSWDDIGRGLTMLGGALAILAVGGLLMIPASVGFLLLGAGVFLIGAGIVMAADGVMLFALAITTLAAAAAVGAEGIKIAVTTILDLIPLGMQKFGEGVILFAETIAAGGVAFAEAFTTLIGAGLTAIDTLAPQIVNTIWNLIVLGTEKIVAGVPYFADAGFRLLTALLNVFAARAGELADAGAAAIVSVLQGLERNLPIITDQAAKTIVSFVDGLGTAVENNTNKLLAAGRKLFRAIVDGVAQAVENGGADIRWAGERIGNALMEGAKNALGINSPSKEFRDNILPSVFEGIEDGTDKNVKRAGRSGSQIGDAMLMGASKALDELKNAVAMDMNMNPTITPVLDMTNFRKEAGMINNLNTRPTLSVSGQYAAASSFEAQRIADARDREQQGSNAPVATLEKQIIFQQTLNSPKALNRIEIYRQSKNLINQAKEALKDD